MGKVVPFKKKPGFTEEEAVRQRLNANPDDLEAHTELFLLSVQSGQFHPDSDYANGILRCLNIRQAHEINKLLVKISPIVESINWHIPSPTPSNRPELNKVVTEKELTEFITSLKSMCGDYTIDNVEKVKKARRNVYEAFFQDDPFLDKLYEIGATSHESVVVPFPEGIRRDPALLNYFIQIFELIISHYGLVDEVVCLLAICQDILFHGSIIKLALKSVPAVNNDAAVIKVLQKKAEKYLSAKYKKNELDILGLFKLLWLQVELKKEPSEICNAIIEAVARAKFEDIIKTFEIKPFDTGNLYYNLWQFKEDLIDGKIDINYTRRIAGIKSNFMADYFLILHEENKYNQKIAFAATLFFNYDLETCPVEYLVLEAIYCMTELLEAGPASEDLYRAAIKYFDKSYYQESMLCSKASLFNAAFINEENPIDRIDLEPLKDTSRKLNSYKESINFLSKFSILSEHGLPIHQAFLNEIEAAKTELEYEFESRQYHKIDAFYELVVKEDFPAVQSHIAESKGQSKFVLTHDQLEILMNKIQEKTDIIRGIKSISAKCDMLMYMHREVYDKQAAILETIKENQEVFEDVINLNTDKIIENIHKKNESLEKHVNLKTCQEFFHGHIGKKLWAQLDEGTRTYLLLGRHLDNTSQYSPADECGFIAIEYALAIENEFATKLIGSFLSKAQHIKYKTADRVKTITAESKITMGEICILMDKTRKVKSTTDLLWPFFSFIEGKTSGGRKVFDFKNALFEIKDKYRNPAAHPSNYSRELLDSFKELLFQKGFIKDYFEAIQIRKGSL